jgi:hypothetical protein
VSRAPAPVDSTAVNSTTYIDATGDVAAGGLDMSTVVVSNDDAGKVTWRIQTPSHAGLTADKEILLAIDVDRNPGTGSSAGNEYGVFVEGRENAVGFYRYDPAQRLYLLVQGAPVASRYSANVLTIDLNRSAFGSVSIFDFELYTGPEDFPTYDDFAPNTGKWTFEIKIGGAPTPPPATNRVAITSFTKNPRVPLAGEGFEVTVIVRRVGRPGRWNGTVYCTASVGGRELRLYASPGTGRASCLWNIPLNAAGKILRGSIGVNEGGGPIVTRRFSGRVIDVGAQLSIEGGIAKSPSRPTSGQPFYYRFGVAVERGGQHRRIVTGRVSCRAVISGRFVPAFQHEIARNSGIRCAWNIPSGTSGRTFNASIQVRSEGGTLTHRYTQRIG